LFSAGRAENKNIHPRGKNKSLPLFQINIPLKSFEFFSFAVPSTAKEIIFNSAPFASQAKRAVELYKKYVIELTN
jgi:hypothetical protein